MNSTTSHSSPYKLILIVIGVVVSLHVLTAMALVMIKPQSVPAQPLEADEVTPIEIELVTPPVNIEQIVTKEVEVEPTREDNVQPKAKSIAAVKPQVVKKLEPTNKSTPVVKKQTVNEDRKVVESKDKVVEDKPKAPQQPIKKQPVQVANTSTQEELSAQRLRKQQRVLAAQAEAETALQAENLRKQQQAQKEAQDKANAAKEAQKRVAERQALASAQAQVEQEAAAQATSNEPAAYGNIGQSSWLREPVFTSIQNKNYGFRGSEASIRVSMTVDSSGNISNIKISQSSGKNAFDRDFVNALSRAKLNPATRGNAPTKSIANFSFRMTL
ncbi:cell envelope integrity protein TolA [Psychrobacter sp. DM4]|uniref:cell envelope integrity protein TolA n=1 Tax=Psychrobacter sp. DM4 TaxID=3440637 RepID=UPI003F509C6F